MPDGLILARRPSVAVEALAGLQAARKTLPPKLFYDEAGCELFGRITELPEYYPTRTERALLAARAAEMVADIPAGAVLVEYGASREDKAAILLAALAGNGRAADAYVPIDVAAPALSDLQARMRATHPDLAVQPIAGDFTTRLVLPDDVDDLPRLGFFPGSTIGNMDLPEAQMFLRTVRMTLGAGASFLVGVDLRKDPAILVPAYDDRAGVTAAFNLNLLARLNREAEADFDLASFRHRAVWNDQESRIEMHLESLADQVVRVAGARIAFAAGETIHTENSYKHSVAGFARLAESAGWQAEQVWKDSQDLFSIHLLSA